jgi:transglutaminase-like cysteine proteinase BTLCP
MASRLPFGPLRHRLLSAVLHCASFLAGGESVWERVMVSVPPGVFGPGSHDPFAAYFRGASCVPVRSIDDIVAWLQTCEYVSDVELFHEADHWQHPAAFEQLRRGDCEDFALWAWRKLAEIGVEAEFFVGRVVGDSADRGRQHAWVVYRVDESAFLFEPAASSRSTMIRAFADAMAGYEPHFAVNHRFDTYAFVGCTSRSGDASIRCADPAAAI